MLAVSETALTKLLYSLNYERCHQLLRHLSTALNEFSAQRKASGTAQQQISIHQPPRTSIVSEKWGSTTLFMPVSDNQSTGFKVVTVPKTTTAANGIRGVINILSPDGQLEGILSAAEITAFRTALATMIPFTRCSSWISRGRIVIFGSGKQAEWHARLALLTAAVPEDIKSIAFINRSQQRLESSIVATLIPDLRQRYPHLDINAYSREQEEAKNNYQTRLRADLASSDAIFCCTPSTDPLFTYDDLYAGPYSSPLKHRFISLIGSYKPHMQEIDSETLLSGTDSKIYVDSIEACMAEAGELIKAKVNESQLIELGELDDAGVFSHTEDSTKAITYPELPYKDVNVIFKCVGMGIMDLAIARSLLNMAREQGYGTVIDGF